MYASAVGDTIYTLSIYPSVHKQLFLTLRTLFKAYIEAYLETGETKMNNWEIMNAFKRTNIQHNSNTAGFLKSVRSADCIDRKIDSTNPFHEPHGTIFPCFHIPWGPWKGFAQCTRILYLLSSYPSAHNQLSERFSGNKLYLIVLVYLDIL